MDTAGEGFHRSPYNIYGYYCILYYILSCCIIFYGIILYHVCVVMINTVCMLRGSSAETAHPGPLLAARGTAATKDVRRTSISFRLRFLVGLFWGTLSRNVPKLLISKIDCIFFIKITFFKKKVTLSTKSIYSMFTKLNPFVVIPNQNIYTSTCLNNDHIIS